VKRHSCQRTHRFANNRIESDHRHVKRRLRAMQGARTRVPPACPRWM
jgi:transposase-like protein